MTRLRSLPPRIAEAKLTRTTAPPSLLEAKAPRLLNGRPWRRKREAVLLRDDYLCVVCRKRGRLTPASEVDHIVPLHQGGTDEGTNLQSLCHRCHAIKTAVESGGRGNPHPEWLPLPACPVILVTGPPCGGKTTYCTQHAQRDDVVIDLDECFLDVCGVHGHQAPRTYLDAAIRWRNKQLAELAGKRLGKAYVIVTAPTYKEVTWWLTKLGAIHVLCNPGLDVCLERAAPVHRSQIVQEWYARHTEL